VRANIYERQARAGLSLLAKRLEKLSEDAGKIGASRPASSFQRDAASVNAVLAAPDRIALPEVADARQRLMLRAAFSLLAHNLKAASGTVGALGRDDWAKECLDEAQDIEEHILHELDEQASLPMTGTDLVRA